MTEVLMPLMGEGITEATLVRWLKQPGEALEKDQPLLEVSTDKVDTEIPAPASGTLLQVLAKDGDTVAVNQVIAIIGAAGASVAPSSGAGSRPAGLPPPPQPAAQFTAVASVTMATSAVKEPLARLNASGPQRSSPLVRKMAKAEAIDLTSVVGSGLHGRITRRDLEAHKQQQPTVSAGPGPGPGLTSAAPRLVTKTTSGGETLDGVPVRRERLSRMRSLIAEHMVRSVRTSPHVTTIFEIDLHRVVKLRDKAKAGFASREGFNLTFTPFFVYAAVQAIKRYPVVNCSVDDQDVLWKDQINVGVAVAIEQGLIVPVIRDAGELNLTGIARRLNDLASRARTKKLLPEEVQGGTFSITNPGMFGSLVSTPIINQPQVAILSIGKIIKRPVVIDDLIGIRPLVQIGLTFDHRVVDGEGGARYLAALQEVLEGFPETAL